MFEQMGFVFSDKRLIDSQGRRQEADPGDNKDCLLMGFGEAHAGKAMSEERWSVAEVT